ncbi:MAG TPA: ABC transporter permease [Burkholderiales bacterium]|nr:ABC transporter permease [Burkholderiales bacterium]
MSPAALTLAAAHRPESPGLWTLAWRRFLRDRLGAGCLAIVVVFVAVALASAAGLIASDWSHETAVSYAPPNFLGGSTAPDEASPTAVRDDVSEEIDIKDPLADELAEIRKALAGRSAVETKKATLPLGADKWGRDVLLKLAKGTETSLLVGLSAALLATFLGTLFGAQAGYFGGRIDDFFNWLYSVLTSIPYLLLILAIAAVLNQKGTSTVVLILGLTGWTGIFRLVRAEYLKHKVREYVLAAGAIGASDTRRMFAHILPNVSHVVLVQLSLHVVLFIKSEVILSFLGFGVGVETVSWGSMLNEAQAELLIGKWWQLAAATAAMAVLVTAFSLFTDALRDALDPRLR